MIPELGHFALILALAVAVVQGVVPLIGACCLHTGGCLDGVNPFQCDDLAGDFQGFGTACRTPEGTWQIQG